MDIKEKIEELVEKIKSDDELMEKFRKEPVKVIESLIGIDLPDDQAEQIINGIKAKIKLDDIGDMLGGLGGLFGKKK